MFYDIFSNPAVLNLFVSATLPPHNQNDRWIKINNFNILDSVEWFLSIAEEIMQTIFNHESDFILVLEIKLLPDDYKPQTARPM